MGTPAFPAELDSLYRREGDNLRRYARRRIRDPEDADDLVSEAFRVLAERGTIQDLRNPAGFLMGTLCNLIASAHRQAYKRRSLISGGADECAFPASPDIADAYELSERN